MSDDLPCVLCSQKNIKYEIVKDFHYDVARGVKLYVCDLCDLQYSAYCYQSFPDIYKLLDHLTLDHDDNTYYKVFQIIALN